MERGSFTEDFERKVNFVLSGDLAFLGGLQAVCKKKAVETDLSLSIGVPLGNLEQKFIYWGF
jgi:hypothetical protein